jgi:hypothetical protein
LGLGVLHLPSIWETWVQTPVHPHTHKKKN